jgi:hypothetical protein
VIAECLRDVAFTGEDIHEFHDGSVGRTGCGLLFSDLFGGTLPVAVVVAEVPVTVTV